MTCTYCDRCRKEIKLGNTFITGYIEVAPGMNRGDEELWINVMHGNSKYCSLECFIDEIKERFIKKRILEGMARSHAGTMQKLNEEFDQMRKEKNDGS